MIQTEIYGWDEAEGEWELLQTVPAALNRLAVAQAVMGWEMDGRTVKTVQVFVSV